MKIYIITQEDVFAIPRNIQLLTDSNNILVKGIATVHTTNSLSNKKSLLLKSFSLISLFKFAWQLFWIKVLNFFDLILLNNLLINKKSIKTISKKYNIPLKRIANVNDPKFINELKQLDLDLIVSFSAPSIFKTELLDIPKKGCINLHCSYLPNYSGILPSFWVLYHDEKETGVTIHYMDDKIDNGKILAQKKVEISDTISWLDLIIKTKRTGGDLMISVLSDFDSYSKLARNNELKHDSYNSWPTIAQFKELGRKRKLA